MLLLISVYTLVLPVTLDTLYYVAQPTHISGMVFPPPLLIFLTSLQSGTTWHHKIFHGCPPPAGSFDIGTSTVLD